jgi:hypothetical protein
MKYVHPIYSNLLKRFQKLLNRFKHFAACSGMVFDHEEAYDWHFAHFPAPASLLGG